MGEELVLFRHEKTFFNPAVLGVLISDDMDDAKVDELLEQAKECEHERVGVILIVGPWPSKPPRATPASSRPWWRR